MKHVLCALAASAVLTVPSGALQQPGRAAAQASRPPATLKLDHIWIATETGASAERAALEKAGFRIAPSINRHDGQGTASVTVEFENGFLELIYADPSVPVVGEGGAVAQRRFGDRARWRTLNVSPFGLAVTRTPQTPAAFPFETWRISSEWMAPGTFMEMLTPRGSRATNVALHPSATDEAQNLRLIAAGGEAAWPFLHPNGARRLTSVVIFAPDEGGLPPSAAFVNESGAARLAIAGEWLAEITLDEGAQNKTRDLRPALPLVVHF